jgi:DNA-binding response OmpR family regulator/DnaJ-domain-containing protein 1
VARSETVNLLIVDDDRSTQRVLADALTRQGFVVTVERDGEWALKTFEKKRFDAVLLDLLLPAINGYEVAQRMRATPRGRRVPIVMISGVYKNAIHRREAVQKHGAFAFLEKPLDLDALYQTLRDALGDRYPRPRPPEPPPPPLEEDEATGEHMADDHQREEVVTVEQHARELQRQPTGLTTRGDFSQRPFAEVLAEAYRWRASGALLLRRDKVKKIVYFRDGTPELVKSNLLVECLGRVLVREKMISEAECEESIKRMKASGRMQGTVLIEMGCISPHNLQHALHVQLQEKLFDLFRWERGEYQFNPRVALPPEPISLGMTCAQLILQGVRRGYDTTRLAQDFGGVDAMYVYPSDDPLQALQDAGLGKEERELLLLSDGHKTVATLRALEILPPVETDRLLFAMRAAQMIVLKDQPAEGRPRVSFADVAAASKPAEPPPPPLPAPPPLPPPAVKPPPLPRRPAAKPASELPWEPERQAAPPAPPPSPAAGKRPPPAPEPVVARPLGSLLPELSEVLRVPELSSTDRAVREQLAAKASAMRQQDYFEILGVKRSASREAIKRAYFTLAREYHPDKHFQTASAELRQLAQQIYDTISTAHDTLTDPAERKRYLDQLADAPPPAQAQDVGRVLAAENQFQRGEALMRQRQYAEARAAFEEAIALYPDEGEFHAWLGWSQFQADPQHAEVAVRSIERAVALNPKLDKSYLFLGYLHKATGRPDKAEKQFEKAIQSNPDCTEALRELRLLGRQRR